MHKGRENIIVSFYVSPSFRKTKKSNFVSSTPYSLVNSPRYFKANLICNLIL